MENSKKLNSNLHSAKKQKNDEFYTQLSDIEREMQHYKEHFAGKTIYCNCDDPYESNFFKYFALNFEFLGLKKLIATCYVGSPIANRELSLFDDESVENKTTKSPHKIEITEIPDMNQDGAVNLIDVELLLASDRNHLTRLKGDGDFRSKECIELLKEADIVVTNPPFSLFREYVAQLMEYNKKYIIIGNINAISYKECFLLIKQNRMWLGYNTTRFFKKPDGTMYETARSFWFTNLDHTKRHEKLTLFQKYNETDYPKYDNYEAIEISKAVDIPVDYNCVMGVPITFLDKYNPEQFEILGLSASAGYDKEIVGLEKNNNFKDARPLINGKNTYARIFIQKYNKI